MGFQQSTKTIYWKKNKILLQVLSERVDICTQNKEHPFTHTKIPLISNTPQSRSKRAYSTVYIAYKNSLLMNLRPNSKQEIFVNFFLKVKNLCSLKNKGSKKTMSLLKEF